MCVFTLSLSLSPPLSPRSFSPSLLLCSASCLGFLFVLFLFSSCGCISFVLSLFFYLLFWILITQCIRFKFTIMYLAVCVLSRLVPLWARAECKKARVCLFTTLGNKEFVLSCLVHLESGRLGDRLPLCPVES